MKYFVEGQDTPLLELKEISAEYGAVRALRDLNLKILPGEIHAVVGEHGAGKSTLAKILISLMKPSEGEVIFAGKPIKSKSINETMAIGIRMVFQRLQLNDGISVADNLFLNNKNIFRHPFQRYSSKKVQKLAEIFFEENEIALDPANLVGELELPEKALLAIVRNLYNPPRLLILDETLEKLSSQGLECIISWLKKLKKMGAAVLYITHRIDDLYILADRVSILRRGELILSEDVRGLDKINLIKLAYTQFDVLDKKNRRADEFNKLLKYNDAVLRKLPIGLIVSNHLNEIKLMNETAREMFGYDECPDLSVETLFAQNRSIIELIKDTKNVKRLGSWSNIPLIVKSHSYKIDLIIYPLFEEDEAIGNMVIIEDVTEREDLREKLILSEKLAGIGILAAGVAHEINNPLGVITNYLESFRQNKIPQSNWEDVINYLFEQVDYIAHIISNLVSFSQEDGTMTDSIELNSEIDRIIRLIRVNGDNKNISIEYSPTGRDVWVKIAKHDFGQILLNLFKNSFEALGEGGGICLEITPFEIGDESKIKILFYDTGPGIEFSDPNDVFLPFKSSKTGMDNYGLGLSLCFTILKKCSGEISVRNRTQGGCEFEIILPRDKSDVQFVDMQG